MAKRSKKDQGLDETVAGAAIQPEPDESGHFPDLSIVLPISMLIGGVVSYPSLSAAAEGTGDLMGAITQFLVATLIATVGVGVNVLLFRSWSADGDHSSDEEQAAPDTDRPTSAPPPGPAGGPPPTIVEEIDEQASEIDEALAATDALVHER